MIEGEKDTPEQSASDGEDSTFGELGVVFGGWHPGPPAPDPPSECVPPDDA